MKKADSAAQVRRQLDRRLKQFAALEKPDPPLKGWIRAVRKALGMTSVQLGRRLGISQPAVAALEASEQRGAIELGTLRRVAEALDCRLVYALVPRSSLENVIRERAKPLLRRRRAPIDHSMALESQEVRESDFEERLREFVRETDPRFFWD